MKKNGFFSHAQLSKITEAKDVDVIRMAKTLSNETF